MSEPVTNVQIEDVLSSIRRLVSNDERPKPVTPATDAPSHVAPERLVLTPALRIDNAAASQGDHARASEATAQLGADGAIISAATTRLSTYIALPENACPDEAFKDLKKVRNLAGTSATDDPARLRAPRDPKAELKARVAELEEIVSRQGDQWEPDGASPDANSGSTGAPLPWDDCDGDLDDDTQGDTAADDPVSSAVGAALCNLAVKQGGASNDAVVGPDTHAADNSMGAGALERGSGRNVLAASGVLNETALHDLVADIVRQELQGALGERITRNVRNLVRREIHRALSISQESQ